MRNIPDTVLAKALDRAMHEVALDSGVRANLKNTFFTELEKIITAPEPKSDVPKNTI
jgi:hypothetical protein